jgi:hypothetical protein
MPFSEENQNYRSVAPWTVKTTVLMPTFLSKTTVLMPTFEKRAFIKGEMFGNNMAKRRSKRQRFTRQVRASIKDFLRGAEFAPMIEILDHVGEDDTLEGLSRKERRDVAHTVMKAPVFHCFKTANSVSVGNSYSKKPRTLWKVNEGYEEFIPFKKD